MKWWWTLLVAMDAHEGQAAWAQAIGSMIGLAIAISVPAALEFSRRNANRAQHLERRRAAFVVMRAVASAIGANHKVAPGEIEAIGALLADLDVGLFNEGEAVIFAKLRARVARAGSTIHAVARLNMMEVFDNPFDVAAAHAEIEPLRRSLGVGTVRGPNNGL